MQFSILCPPIYQHIKGGVSMVGYQGELSRVTQIALFGSGYILPINMTFCILYKAMTFLSRPPVFCGCPCLFFIICAEPSSPATSPLQAVNFLPAICNDMGTVCETEIVSASADETSLTVNKWVMQEIGRGYPAT